MPCGVTRDQAILWKKPVDYEVDYRAAIRQQWDWSFIHGKHCSSCDSEWTGDGDCPNCGEEAFA